MPTNFTSVLIAIAKQTSSLLPNLGKLNKNSLVEIVFVIVLICNITGGDRRYFRVIKKFSD